MTMKKEITMTSTWGEHVASFSFIPFARRRTSYVR